MLLLHSIVGFASPENEVNQLFKEKYKPGILLQNGKYELDTTVILSNQNLPFLIKELEKEELIQQDRYENTPKVVRNLLNKLTGKFDIANPGKKWQVGCVHMGKPLPSRQLVYLGVSEELLLMTYYTGGIGKAANTMIIKYKKGTIIDFWKGHAPYNTDNKDEIISYLKGNMNITWGLNTNVIYL